MLDVMRGNVALMVCTGACLSGAPRSSRGLSLMSNSSPHRFKVVLLGEGRVGKTSILLRYVKGEYTDKQQSTIQASYLDRKVQSGSMSAQLSIWDTAGQERFHALGPIYYRDADGALLVYDISDTESFTKVRKWVKELRKIVGTNIALVIAGNKCDLEKSRSVSMEEAASYAESVGAAHCLTSAKQNKGLDECFVELTQRMVKRRTEENAQGGGAKTGGGRLGSRLVVVDDAASTPKKESCC